MDFSQKNPVILQVISAKSIGGAEKIALNLSLELRNRGYSIIVACPPGSWIEKQLRRAGIPSEAVPFKGIRARLLTRRQIAKIIQKYHVDLVHTHLERDSMLALPVAKAAGIRSLCTMHNYGENLYCNLADRCTAITEAVKSDLLARGVEEDRITLIPNGIPISLQSAAPSEFRSSHGYADTDVLVGVVTRLIHRKGIDVLIQAISQCPNIKLVIGGYGRRRYVKKLKQLVNQLGLQDRVRFLGRVDDPERVMAALDAYIVPSREEGMGIVLMEAMVAGTPVVASAVGGIPEVVQHEETGLLVPSERPDLLAQAIDRLLADAALSARLKKNALELVLDNYSLATMADSFELVYGQLLGEEMHQPPLVPVSV